MYRRILLAYDGSLEGARALREGALLANTCCAEVFLLCVVPETPGTRMAEGVYAGVVAQQIDGYKALLARGVDRLKELGLRPSSRLVIGEPSPVIAAVAKEIDADLVVVGHHSEGFLTRWWSGSSQSYLSDHVHCSMLIGQNAMSDEEFERAVKNRGMPVIDGEPPLQAET